MCSYWISYDDDVSNVIRNGLKFSSQTLQDYTVEPKSFDAWNKEELNTSEQNYKGLYAMQVVVASTKSY